jgi:hypothetical protein
VPYEIGFSRSTHIPVLYLVLESIRKTKDLPEYVRLGANFWSVDELAHWATQLSGGRPVTLNPATAGKLAQFVRSTAATHTHGTWAGQTGARGNRPAGTTRYLVRSRAHRHHHILLATEHRRNHP